ncbi:MAG: hypothetical protein V3S13_03410 [Candidatus Omnitrophota bacterium]
MDDLPLLERLAHQVGSVSLAKNLLIERGHMNADGSLTQEGEERDKMGAEGRALERHVKRYGGEESDYEYDPETNSCFRV